MRNITMVSALGEALVEEMRVDEQIIVYGEDIGVQSTFKVTEQAWDEFGGFDLAKARVMDTPISETAIVGSAVGCAIAGMRPVIEIMWMDFAAVAMDEIVNQAAKMRYMSGGKAKVPMVIRMSAGGGQGAAAQHSQSLEAWFMHVPGLKVVMPSNAYDAKGLLKAAIRDDNPVIFLEHHALYNVKGEVPADDYTIPLGKAGIKKKGDDVTVVATMTMVQKALDAADSLKSEGIDIEIIDPRTIFPLDKETIIDSIEKTGKLVVVEEACRRGGFNAELVATIADEAFDALEASPVRIGGLETPVPFSPPLEQYYIPSEEDISKGVRKVVNLASY